MRDDDGWAASTEGVSPPTSPKKRATPAGSPPRRDGWALALRLTAGVLLIAIAGGALLALAR